MYALLILKHNGNGELRVLVQLTDSKLKKRVIDLLETNKPREAFDLLKSNADVEDYLPYGRKPSVMPQVTLIEDLL